MRLLYARVGIPHCPECGSPIRRQSVEQIVDAVMGLAEGQRLQILSPMVRGRKGEYRKVLEEVLKEGFIRVRIDGEVKDLSDDTVLAERLDRYKQHDIDVVVDRLIVRHEPNGFRKRLADSVETALKMGKGLVTIELLPATGEESTDALAPKKSGRRSRTPTAIRSWSSPNTCLRRLRIELRRDRATQLLVQLALRRM